jgi:hypothetical protein
MGKHRRRRVLCSFYSMAEDKKKKKTQTPVTVGNLRGTERPGHRPVSR